MTSHQMVSLCVVVYFLMTVSSVPSSAQELRARVVGGTAEAGRLEIFYNGTWNTVCDDGFGQKEALVACRMLGFNNTTAAAVRSTKYGEGSGPILFDDLQCVGVETSLAQCKHSGLYKHNCEHSEDVAVACSIAQQLKARVVGGTAEAGRLEIFYDGTWNTVCDDSFGQEEALVACRMLGFNSTTAVVVGSDKYGAGSGPILFSYLQCVGNEDSLAHCKYPGLYRHICEHWEDVGIACNMTAQSTSLFWIGLVIVPILILIGVLVFFVIRQRAAQIKTSDDKEMSSTGSRGGNAQNETTNGNEGERTSKKSDSSTSSPGQAAGNGSKSGGSTPRSSSSGSDKPSTNPNYTSTALQEVEIHPYMDLHTRDPTYASTTSSKDPHMYMELKTLKALQPGSEKNGNDGYETPQVPGQANKSSDGYETPQPPREGRRRSATYANQGVPADPIQEEVNYYNEA